MKRISQIQTKFKLPKYSMIYCEYLIYRQQKRHNVKQSRGLTKTHRSSLLLLLLLQLQSVPYNRSEILMRVEHRTLTPAVDKLTDITLTLSSHFDITSTTTSMHGGRESSTRCDFRKHLQIEKAPANQENIFITSTAGAANAHNTNK